MSDLQTYRNMLRINRHRLDDELEIQAEVMDRVSQEVNRQNSRMLEAKENLARVEARLFVDASEENSKATNAQLDAAVKRHRERIDAWKNFQAARHSFDEWEALRDAWKQRGFSLKTLADLYTSHYFTISDHQTRGRSDRDQARISKHQEEHVRRRVALNDVRNQTAQPEARPRRRALTQED